MSTIGASLAGAAVFAVAALWFSLQNWLAERAPQTSFLPDLLRLLGAGSIAVGSCLIALSVAEIAQVAPSWVDKIVFLAIPLAFVLIWRLIDTPSRSHGKDEAAGALLARGFVAGSARNSGQNSGLKAA